MTWINPDHVDEAVYDPASPLEPDEPAVEALVADELLTEEEMYILADARKTLKTVADRAQTLSHDDRVTATKSHAWDRPSAFDIGKLHEALIEAEDAIFNAMNTAGAYCKVDVPDKLMHPHNTVKT